MTGLERALARNKEAAGLTPPHRENLPAAEAVSLDPPAVAQMPNLPQEGEPVADWKPAEMEAFPASPLWEDEDNLLHRMAKLQEREALRFPFGRDF